MSGPFPISRAAALAFALLASQAAAQAPGAYLAARSADALGAVGAAARFYAEALEADPGNVALMEGAALNLIASGQIEAGAAMAERLAELAPDHRVANLALVAAALAQGDHVAARERLAEQPDAFLPLTRRLLEAWAAFGAGDVAAAEAALAELSEPPIFRLFADAHLGMLRHAAGDAAGAIEAFERAEAAASGPTTRLSLAHGAALEALGRDDEARELYERTEAASRLGDPTMAAAIARLDAGGATVAPVATMAEGAAEALFGVATALGGDSGRRFALAHARLSTHLRPDLAPAQLLIAELLQGDGQDEAALAVYAATPASDPLWARAQIGRAGALEALGRTDAAIEALRALVATNATSLDAQLALADQLRRAERFDEAATRYDRALELAETGGDPDWTLYYQSGIAHERAGNWPVAEAHFLRALELEPDQPLVLNYLGYTWVEMGHNLAEAQAMIEKAVDQRPDNGYITDSLGWVLYKLGDFDGAVTWLERAVELAPVDPVINDHFGDALWRVGRRLEAQFQWKRARSLDPEPKDLARIKRKLAVGLDIVLEEEAEAARGAASAGDGG
ncbi:tetratricopeptide repeat protein [Rubrimonas cliftonensis]|uniref:Flp pilus assembly protein TadD, contains TPR repeats n=1 Tax=Rubrimonas cliftonensis TaxID=89524 RepID=A0A1H3VE62_9RHOB|nr:tetratricopeptide repeat protein [Rubrimonas cliftonensis]SDZ73097.1 Flp pilus assembly protein TadD, contains TPR repeats [Rubrimonas cliftonensis]